MNEICLNRIQEERKERVKVVQEPRVAPNHPAERLAVASALVAIVLSPIFVAVSKKTFSL